MDQSAAFVSGEVVNTGGIPPLFIGTGELLLRAWFGTVEGLAVYVLLGTTIVNRFMLVIFPAEQKMVSWHSRPVAIITARTAINSINADVTVLNVNTKSHDDGLSNEFIVCCVACQITMTAYSQAAVLVSGQGTGLVTNETHHNVVAHLSSMEG